VPSGGLGEEWERGWFCRLDLKDPPTDVWGGSEIFTRALIYRQVSATRTSERQSLSAQQSA